MPFPIHPHMLRHACGFKLANDGHDTRALQHYLGHKNIRHTARCTDHGARQAQGLLNYLTMAPQRSARAARKDRGTEKTTRYIVDHPSGGDGTLRGMRSRGPIAVSTSIISRFGLRLDDSFSGDCPPGAGSAAGSAFISTRCALPTA